MVISDIEKSEFIRNNFPANKSSSSRRRLLYGSAINDADYIVKPTKENQRLECIAYRTWRDMIQRCLDPGYKAKRKCYESASVDSSWLSFMCFRSWWILNHVDGWQLDKDLISDSKIYGPSTCIYAPAWLNTIIPDRGMTRGVHFDKSRGKFKASINEGGVTINIGRYNSFEEAKSAFISMKIDQLTAEKERIDAVDKRIYPRLIKRIQQES